MHYPNLQVGLLAVGHVIIPILQMRNENVGSLVSYQSHTESRKSRT